jgi:Ca2+/Na+ antiporter
MKCINHSGIEAAGTYRSCGKPLCGECTVVLAGNPWCRQCLESIVGVKRKPPHHWPWRKMIAGLLSVVPGAGHMFLGSIAKGFALMGFLFLSIFLIILHADSTGMYWIVAYLVPTLCVLFLCYAVFDSLAIVDAEQKKPEDRKPREDETLKLVWERVLMSRRTIGWVILLAGIVGLLNIFSEPLNELTRTYLFLEIPFAGLVLPAAFLVIGILLLGKGRRRE